MKAGRRYILTAPTKLSSANATAWMNICMLLMADIIAKAHTGRPHSRAASSLTCLAYFATPPSRPISRIVFRPAMICLQMAVMAFAAAPEMSFKVAYGP